jgi:hypothetical protein
MQIILKCDAGSTKTNDESKAIIRCEPLEKYVKYFYNGVNIHKMFVP